MKNRKSTKRHMSVRLGKGCQAAVGIIKSICSRHVFAEMKWHRVYAARMHALRFEIPSGRGMFGLGGTGTGITRLFRKSEKQKK